MTNLWHWILPTVTRSLSKKLSEEPFKVPYPVASTASTPVEEVYAAKIIFNIFSSTNLYVFCVFFLSISFYLQLLLQLSLSYTATLATFQLFHPVLLQVAFSLLVVLWPIDVKPIVVKQSVTPSLLSMFPDQFHLLCSSLSLHHSSLLLYLFSGRSARLNIKM